MKKISNFLYLYISEFLSKAAMIVIFFVLARKLSTADYGIFIFLTTFTQFFLIISTFGTDTYANIVVPKFSSYKIDIFSVRIVWNFIAFFSCLIGLFFISPRMNIPLLIGFFVSLRIIFGIFDVNWYFQAKLKFDNIALSNVVFAFLLILSSLLYGNKLSVFALLFSFAFLLKYLFLFSKEKFTIEKKNLLKTSKESFWYFLIPLCQQFNVNISKIFIPVFIGLSDLAFFDASIRFVTFIELGAIVSIKFILPYSVKYGETKYFYWLGIISLISTLIFYVFNMHTFFITTIYGENFYKAIDFTKQLYPYIVFSILAIITSNLLLKENKIKLISYFNIFAAPINLICLYCITKHFHIYGLIWYLISYKLIELIYNFSCLCYYKLYKKDILIPFSFFGRKKLIK